jgi:hypothetical protein
MMVAISTIKDSLNPKFIINNGIMQEKSQSMRINISYNEDYVLFNSDHRKSNPFDCFHPNIKTLNRRADYIIIAIKKGTIHIVVTELKASNNPIDQLELTKYFADFIINRIKYKHQSLTSKVVIRKLGIFKDKLPGMYKNLTKPGRIYNSDNIAFITAPKKLNLAYFL